MSIDMMMRYEMMLGFAKKINNSYIVPVLASSLAAIIGILTIFGWQTRISTLIYLNDDFTAFHYNTALCVLAIGFSVISILKEHRFITFMLGMFVCAVGYLSFTEYIFNINVGINHIFFTGPNAGGSFSAGRISPNSALIICFLGTSLVLLSNYIKMTIEPRKLYSLLLFLNLISMTVCFTALFGYIFDLPGTYGWVDYSKIAPMAAISLFLASLTLASLIYTKAKESNLSLTQWLPWYVFVVVTVISLSFWHASWAYVEKNELQQNTIASESMRAIIQDELTFRKQALVQMASRWQVRKGGTPYNEWSKDALNIETDQPGFQSIEWADPSLIVRWVVPLKGNEAALKTDLKKDTGRSKNLTHAITTGQITVTPMLTLKSGQKGFLIYAPIGKKNGLKGVIIGAINAKRFFDDVFADTTKDYNIVIYYQNELIYSRHSSPVNKNLHRSITYHMKELDWDIVSWPVPLLAEKQHPWLPIIVLLIGLSMALMLSFITYLAQIARKNLRTAKDEIKTRKQTEQQLIVYSKKLKKLSFVDPLTGIDNRRSLTKLLQEELNQMKKSDVPLSLILIDIDYFKQINDTYGHVTGDAVLQKIGNILRKSTRSTDSVARYGGEEFFIILRNTTDRQAYVVAEKLRTKVAEHVFQCEKKMPFNVTCSFGVYQVSPQINKITKAFDIVDGALYTAKNSGRNCVVLV
jgi:diguanylate cyclase (GGDEF)-like protein